MRRVPPPFPHRRIGALAVLLGLLGLGPVSAPADAAPAQVVLAGSLQSELGCGQDWDPACAATRMSDPDDDGVYSYRGEVPAGAWEFKAALGGNWDEAYGVEGENAKLVLAGPAVLDFSFDSATKLLSVKTPELGGDFEPGDESLIAAPVNTGDEEIFYFVLTDRFSNGDTANDTGGVEGDRLRTGFDPADKGFYHGGDIRGIIDRLDYIQGLGATAIWLTPSFVNRPVQGEGENASAGYHGYWVTDFTRIDPHLGGNEALAELRDAAHARGMKLYLDVIMNHTADLIDYEEGRYTYIDTASAPYTDESGNAVDIAALANRDGFPENLRSAYTPIRAEGNEVVPAALNDVTLYHNRGDSTWEGESTTMGDFVGLDDLMTESPVVEKVFEDVYTKWIDFGVDGFRIDTVKHVNMEFWQKWTEAIQAHDPDFFTFGEVYSADTSVLSPYVKNTRMGAVLDFAFQSQALSFAKGASAKGLSRLFASDSDYLSPRSSAASLPTFLGNHDMGRIGYLLGNGSGSEELLARDRLAHSLMLLSRGQPVIYYGDEQGFAGTAPGNDKDARQDMFPTRVEEVAAQPLIDGSGFGTGGHFSTDYPLYRSIAELSALRKTSPGLSRGAQIELHASEGPGVYAFSRVDAEERIEYIVALNNSGGAQTVDLKTLTPSSDYRAVHGDAEALSSDGEGALRLEVPALSALVLKAERPVASGDPAIALDAADGTGINGAPAMISATARADRYSSTSFSYRELGGGQWKPLGTAQGPAPRLPFDTNAFADGTALEVRAITIDAGGAKAADSALLIVGNDLSGIEETPDPNAEDPLVTVPGSLNRAMGCVQDWMPDCEAARLTKDPESGIFTAAFDLPAGSYEYKIAIGGTWSENYGAQGTRDGSNIPLEVPEDARAVFYYDPDSHRAWTSLDGPIITLPGSFQEHLGCTRGSNGGNWAPDCLAPLMIPQGDGTWAYSTSRLPEGSYEVKVAHGLSWDENYGVDGEAGGANYSFSTNGGAKVDFTYTLETHRLLIEASDPPLLGEGTHSAYWVDATTLAWPASLLPEGISAPLDASAQERLAFSLITAPEGGARILEGRASGGTPHPLEILGGLDERITEAHPNLKGYIALRLKRPLEAAELRETLSGQNTVLGESDGAPFAFTGVQLAPVLDALYGNGAVEAELGVSWEQGGPSFSLWAPTAKSVTLLSWNTGDRLGSGDEAPGPALRSEAVEDEHGVWRVPNADGRIEAGAQYLWEVVVYAPATGRVETNLVTDPYSLALTLDSTRSVAVDLDDPALAPARWLSSPAPAVRNDAARSIYELHIRDFSSKDESVPAELRGTYKAFTLDDSTGVRHLKELAAAGMNTIHLLPSFDIATIPEDRAKQKTPDIPDAGPASEEQQAAVAAVMDEDAFNWGYDPLHWMAPEGSYASPGNQNGGARSYEFREMIGSLHGAGLQVVLDQVYNHTSASGQDEDSVLDRIVPGYYHRLDAAGRVTNSTCCSNIATENLMSEKLMIDSLITWARDYRVDGFRFDLMGHHSADTMIRAKKALSELSLEEDGVDGSKIYLYGEGWNFGEVADNALFTQATQGQLNGTGIGAFNDRLRDGVHGGGPFDEDHRVFQGFGSGAVTDPNGLDARPAAERLADLGLDTDLVKIGLAGNLADYPLVAHDGTETNGARIDYNGRGAGYASQPSESVNYVDAHDNETLFDLLTYKLPAGTPMPERVRMNTLSLATVALGQSPSFWAAGTELLRSKSFDRDSYNSGDHFNGIDWTGGSNGFARGLPIASKNKERWPIIAPLLADPALRPAPGDIRDAKAQALDLLRLRSSTPLFTLGSAELITERLSFPNSGPGAAPGTILMLIEDPAAPPLAVTTGAGMPATGGTDIDPALDSLLVVFNAASTPLVQRVDGLEGREFSLSPIQANGEDPVVKETSWDPTTGTLSVPGRTVAVLVEGAIGGEPHGPQIDTPGGTTDPGAFAAGTHGAGPKAGAVDALARTGAAGTLLTALVLSGLALLIGAGLRGRRRRG